MRRKEAAGELNGEEEGEVGEEEAGGEEQGGFERGKEKKEPRSPLSAKIRPVVILSARSGDDRTIRRRRYFIPFRRGAFQEKLHRRLRIL